MRFLRLILIGLITMGPLAVEAQYLFVTNGDSLTITGYNGGSLDITTPAMINGLPVESIGDEAFSSYGLRSVVITAGVTNIGKYAFADCHALFSVSIPATVSVIGDQAFISCTNLNAINVDAQNQFYGSVHGLLCDHNQETLILCPEGKFGNLTVPATVTQIGPAAFDGCAGLTNVTIGSSVTNIFPAFGNDRALRSITVDPQNLFYSSSGGVLFDKAQSTLIQCPGAAAGTFSVPSGVLNIAPTAFVTCVNLTNISLADTVTNIEPGAFVDCLTLRSLTVGTQNPAFSDVQGVLYDKSQTMILLCPEALGGNFVAPDSVSSVAFSAFLDCAKLTNVVLSPGVTNIGDFAFFGCANLTSMILPGGVTSIGQSVFESCQRLTSVVIPEGVRSLGASSFFGCYKLRTLTIPATVTNIGEDAFGFCYDLTSVYCKGNAPAHQDSVFDYAPGATVFYLPGTTGWGATYDFNPAILWNPTAQLNGPGPDRSSHSFGFAIVGTSGISFLVEGCDDLTAATWLPLQIMTLTNGSVYFSDQSQTNLSQRFYRLRSP
jgi:hypothetical protein